MKHGKYAAGSREMKWREKMVDPLSSSRNELKARELKNRTWRKLIKNCDIYNFSYFPKSFGYFVTIHIVNHTSVSSFVLYQPLFLFLLILFLWSDVVNFKNIGEELKFTRGPFSQSSTLNAQHYVSQLSGISSKQIWSEVPPTYFLSVGTLYNFCNLIMAM